MLSDLQCRQVLNGYRFNLNSTCFCAESRHKSVGADSTFVMFCHFILPVFVIPNDEEYGHGNYRDSHQAHG